MRRRDVGDGRPAVDLAERGDDAGPVEEQRHVLEVAPTAPSAGSSSRRSSAPAGRTTICPERCGIGPVPDADELLVRDRARGVSRGSRRARRGLGRPLARRPPAPAPPSAAAPVAASASAARAGDDHERERQRRNAEDAASSRARLGQARQLRHQRRGERGLEHGVVAPRGRHDDAAAARCRPSSAPSRTAATSSSVRRSRAARPRSMKICVGWISSTMSRSSPSVSNVALMPADDRRRRDLERARDLGVGDAAVVGGEHERPLALADRAVEEVTSSSSAASCASTASRISRLFSVQTWRDVVDHLVVDEQQVGDLVLAEPLALDHLHRARASGTASRAGVSNPPSSGSISLSATGRRSVRRRRPRRGRRPRTPGRRSGSRGAV